MVNNRAYHDYSDDAKKWLWSTYIDFQVVAFLDDLLDG